jgi:hypothetical protein
MCSIVAQLSDEAERRLCHECEQLKLVLVEATVQLWT